MNIVIEWLQANAEFYPEDNVYAIDGGYCDSEVFTISDDKIRIDYSDEYGGMSDRELTVEEFIEEYIK